MTYDLYMDVDEQKYGEYVLWCRANNVPATLDGYTIWLGDQDLDEPEWDDNESL